MEVLCKQKSPNVFQSKETVRSWWCTSRWWIIHLSTGRGRRGVGNNFLPQASSSSFPWVNQKIVFQKDSSTGLHISFAAWNLNCFHSYKALGESICLPGYSEIATKSNPFVEERFFLKKHSWKAVVTDDKNLGFFCSFACPYIRSREISIALGTKVEATNQADSSSNLTPSSSSY